MGIGMGRNLHHVPVAFVAAAAALFAFPWLWNTLATRRLDQSSRIQALAVAIVMGIAFALTLIVRPAGHSFANSIAPTPVERGRRVYIAEGCINCHSQYVRPNTADVAMWGPVTSLEEIRREQPPLIGNRRQGPDLSQVGARRSPLWLRIHFMNPRDVSYDSIMPRYDYLFRDGRGDDLIAYLASLNSPGHWDEIADWQLSHRTIARAGSIDGGLLFAEHCATCHASNGAARSKWSARFHRLPPRRAECNSGATPHGHCPHYQIRLEGNRYGRSRIPARRTGCGNCQFSRRSAGVGPQIGVIAALKNRATAKYIWLFINDLLENPRIFL
jgi:cytochrome c oxidase cbb3-type subunit 2